MPWPCIARALPRRLLLLCCALLVEARVTPPIDAGVLWVIPNHKHKTPASKGSPGAVSDATHTKWHSAKGGLTRGANAAQSTDDSVLKEPNLLL